MKSIVLFICGGRSFILYPVFNFFMEFCWINNLIMNLLFIIMTSILL
jgi:hypothetical protein